MEVRNREKAKSAAMRYESIKHNRFRLAGKRFHFIGIGGVGMSGLAGLLIKNKAIVSGSDQMAGAAITSLVALGADIRIGHSHIHPDAGIEAVVISAAIKEDNPELQSARSLGIKVYKYAELLGKLMARYEPIAVAGTHGKSTASAWLLYCLRRAGVDANFIIGAQIPQLKCSSGVGASKYFVAEACEYDRSFLNIKPKIACLLNIEADHLDYYADEAEIVKAFHQFAAGVGAGGVVIANGNDPNVAEAVNRLRGALRIVTFGFGENCDFTARNLELRDGLYRFDVYRDGQRLGSAKIALPGKHNILNALAVIAMGIESGLTGRQMLELIGEFGGIERRLMLKDRVGQITVIDDYAHHPTEIRASLEAIRQRYEPRKLFCVFQPHQHSRTRFLLKDFTESFALADVTIVPEIYFVRDTHAARRQINAQVLVEMINSNGSMALFIDEFGQICDYLKRNVTEGDVVVTMGAGDIWKVADEYIQWLRENC